MIFFFQKMYSASFYGNLMHRADDDLEDSVYETDSSELDSDSHESSRNQSCGEMNTTQDDDDIIEDMDQTKQPPELHSMTG